MRIIKLVALSAAAVATLGASTAMARPHHPKPHKVCHVEHHHGHAQRVCHWVR